MPSGSGERCPDSVCNFSLRHATLQKQINIRTHTHTLPDAETTDDMLDDEFECKTSEMCAGVAGCLCTPAVRPLSPPHRPILREYDCCKVVPTARDRWALLGVAQRRRKQRVGGRPGKIVGDGEKCLRCLRRCLSRARVCFSCWLLVLRRHELTGRQVSAQNAPIVHQPKWCVGCYRVNTMAVFF